MSTQTRGAAVARPRPMVDRDDRAGTSWRGRLSRAAARGRTRGLGGWERAGLLAILALSAALNLINLANQGYANQYYAAGVKSMLMSWHNFFFVSFDPGGFISIDKPPLGFWIQAASAKLFGFSGWSILLPQAVAGIAAVGIIFALVRRLWGPLAGLTAALALAVTPISVATNRNNTIDSLLVVAVLGAAWAVTRAIESPRHPLRWLILGGVFVGLGFNIKMFEAYLVVPALWAAYLLVARSRPLARFGHLIVATVAMVAVSLSWAIAVDLTPASERPFVGSSTDNTVFELILGHNGFQRLFGRGGSSTDSVASLFSSSTQGAGGVGGVSENGAKGIFRLLNTQLGGQIGWLIPLAIIGIAVAAWTLRPRNLRRWRTLASATGAGLLRRRRTALVIWSGWFVTMAAFFSVAGFFHRYYLTMLAPAVAALVGIGVATLWRAWQGRGLDAWLGWTLPAALLANAAVQAKILADYSAYSRLTPIIIGLSVAAALVLLATRVLRGRFGTRRRIGHVARVALGAAILTLMLAPAVWSGITVQAAANGQASSLPSAGPTSGGGMGGMGGGSQPGGTAPSGGQRGTAPTGMTPPTGAASGTTGQRPATTAGAATGTTGTETRAAGGGGMGGQISTNLLNWLIANRGDATYIVGVQSANGASSIILQTGLPVMAYGGFEGSDPTLTADSLAKLVADGTIRYIIVGGQGGQGGSGTFSVSSWVQQHGTLVSASTWGDSASSVQLYDLAAGK